MGHSFLLGELPFTRSQRHPETDSGSRSFFLPPAPSFCLSDLLNEINGECFHQNQVPFLNLGLQKHGYIMEILIWRPFHVPVEVGGHKGELSSGAALGVRLLLALGKRALYSCC